MTAPRDAWEIRNVLFDGLKLDDLSTVELARRCAALFGTTGVTISLSSDLAARQQVVAFDSNLGAVEDLQFTLGQGPISSVVANGVIAVVQSQKAMLAEWPLFAPDAINAGVSAVAAIPLRVGSIFMGVLVFYFKSEHAINNNILTEAGCAAQLVIEFLLVRQASSPAEQLSEFAIGEQLFGAAVHQATGMVSVQMNCGLEEALLRLRAFAFANDRPIQDIAKDVLDRKLRFQ